MGFEAARRLAASVVAQHALDLLAQGAQFLAQLAAHLLGNYTVGLEAGFVVLDLLYAVVKPAGFALVVAAKGIGALLISRLKNHRAPLSQLWD